jgi:hypothetical protein
VLDVILIFTGRNEVATLRIAAKEMDRTNLQWKLKLSEENKPLINSDLDEAVEDVCSIFGGDWERHDSQCGYLVFRLISELMFIVNVPITAPEIVVKKEK